MSETDEHLEPLELKPWRVLVVAAHPGDIESSGASAAVAKWVSEGVEVVYLLATRGELSIPGTEPAEAALVRSGEQSAAAAAVGVQVVDFLDLDDGAVEPSVALRRAIVRDLRRFGPDVVLVMNHREHEADGTLNDADHRAIGIATLDAVRSAANQWAFRDTGEPHRVGSVLVVGSPTARHALDVTGFEDDAARALAAHEEHNAATSDHPMSGSEWLAPVLRSGGARLATESAAAIPVEQVEYGEGRTCHSFIVGDYTDPDGHARVMKLSRKQKASKSPARARNAVAPSAKPEKKSRRSKAKPAEAPAPVATSAPVPEGAMKFQVRLEKNGRAIGVEVPASVMARLGSEPRPTVSVEVHGTSFETLVGTNDGRRFIAINAERRKAAGIDIDDQFFIGLLPQRREPQTQVEGASTVGSPGADGAAGAPGPSVNEASAEAPPAPVDRPKARRRGRSPRSRTKR